MTSKPEALACVACGASVEAVLRKTFLGFRKAVCPVCGHENLYPLPAGFRVTYWVLVVLTVAGLAATAKTGGGGPGLFGIAAGIALYRDWSLKRRMTSAASAPMLAAEPVPAAPPRAPDDATPSRRPKANYFLRHWRGELSLPVSYWVNGSLLSGVVTLALVRVVNGWSDKHASLRASAAAGMLLLLFSIIAWLWSVVGIWRSAGHYEKTHDTQWGTIARVMMVLGGLAMASTMIRSTIPQIREFALIATGQDPIGEVDVRLIESGKALYIKGTLREGSADKAIRLLQSAPGVTKVVLNSNGGRLHEAEALADAVQQRRLDTYVEDLCASGCTYIFLAGKERAATPNAKIGFHQPSLVGADATQSGELTQKMLNFYRSAGLPERFIARVNDTKSSDMWFPTRDELINARVVTRVSLGGESNAGVASLSQGDIRLLLAHDPTLVAYEKRFPGTMDMAIERAWEVKQRGGSDAQFKSAVRKVVADRLPELLKQADFAQLQKFTNLLMLQLIAARRVSVDACTQFRVGTLDGSNVMPRDLMQEESDLTRAMLAAAPLRETQQYSSDQFRNAMGRVAKEIPQPYIDAIKSPATFANRPELVCDAEIAFYKSVLALDDQSRQVALWGIWKR